MSNRYSRIFHHISTNDLKRNREIAIEKIEEENKIKEEERTIFEIFKRDWRRELRGNRTILNLPEGMTSSNFLTTVLPAAGETAVDQVDPTASASFAPTTNMFGSGADNPALVDAQIRASGSGNGSTGGFDVGGNYLAFQGGTSSSRMALLQPMDATTVDTLTITAIRGTGSNGGEHPDIVGTEELFVIYKTPDMSRSSYLSQDRNQNNVGAFPDDAAIIAINQGDGTLQDYTIAIPEYARQKDVIFGLFQLGNSGNEFDHYGVTDIKFQRKAPVNVVVSLDSPEAISFVRVGTNEGDPKKRKKKVNDQLEASDQYTTKQMGKDFPGQGARLGDEASSMGAPDPFSSASFQEPDASPIGKDEVKKSFANFSADVASTEPEAEPEAEPTTPSSQTTMNPTNDEGEEINVKPVGKIAVQGADAANVDAQEPEPTEPEPTDPDSTEIEEPELDPEELKASEEEKQNKTPKEIEEIEREKYEAEEQKQVNKILDKLLDFAKQIDPLDMPIDLALDIASGIARLGKGINQIRSFLKKISGGRFGSGSGILIDPDIALADSRYQKLFNNIEIMRSNLTGRITTQEYTSKQISDLANSLTISKFTGDEFYTEIGGSYGISDVRHEYVDDNIYVKDGVVYDNTTEKISSLANMETGVRSIDGIGKGYGQMIIPKDGSKPYFHFYDYNYHNLNSSSPTELPDDFITKFGAQTAQVLRSFLPGRIFDDVINRIQGNLNTFGKNLKTRVGLDGWPPGIHGATLTDFKIPLDQLPEETQKMIALHPLSWTDERVANMSDDYLYEQMDLLLDREEIIYQESDDGKSYLDKIGKILKSREANVDPKFAKAFIDVNDQYFELLEKYDELQEIYKKPEASLAETKSREDWRALQEEQKEATTREELHKKFSKGIKIPNPKTDGDKRPDYSEWIEGDKKEYDELIAQQDKFAKDAENYYKNTFSSAADKLFAYQDTLKKEGDKVVGTRKQIAKYRKLAAEYDRTYNEYTRLNALQDEPMNKASELLSAFQDDYKRRMAVWQPYLNELNRVYKEIYDEYQELVDEAYTKYQNTIGVENKDGVYEYVNGGDYTDPSGKTYAGLGTLTKSVQDEIDEINLLIKENSDILGSFDPRYMPEKLSQYLVNNEYKGKTTNWSPEKKGSGTERPDRSQSNNQGGSPSNYGYGSGYSINEPIFGLGAEDGDLIASAEKGNYDLYNWIIKTYNNMDAAEWYLKTGKTQGNPFLPQGTYVPKAQNKTNKKGTMVAHYQPKGKNLFERLKQKQFFNPNDIKPTFPENPPPKLDPKTGMHPDYGKSAKRYKKLDPASANAMPRTGDPETDAVVDKQRTKPRPKIQSTFTKIKKLRKRI